MTKYYIIDTGEELKFGDPIELELVKKVSSLDNNGCKVIHKTIQHEFCEALVPLLLEKHIIEKREVPDNKKAREGKKPNPNGNKRKEPLVDFEDNNNEKSQGISEEYLKDFIATTANVVEDFVAVVSNLNDKIYNLSKEINTLRNKVTFLEKQKRNIDPMDDTLINVYRMLVSGNN